MKNYLKFFWLVPGVTLLFPLVGTILMAASAPFGLGSLAAKGYSSFFWTIPLVGLMVLFVLLGLLIIDRTTLKQINPLKSLALALLCVISPVLVFVAGAVLSGFLR